MPYCWSAKSKMKDAGALKRSQYCMGFGEGELYRLTSHLAVEYERPMLLDVIVSMWERMRGRLHIYQVWYSSS